MKKSKVTEAQIATASKWTSARQRTFEFQRGIHPA